MSKIIHFSEETEITIKDVVDSMTDLQREVMYGIIGKVWTAEPNAPVFVHYFAKLGYIALNITHENFLAIQQLQSDILVSMDEFLAEAEKKQSDPAADVYEILTGLVETKKLRPGEVLNYAHFHWCLDTPEAIVAWQTGRDKWTVNNCDTEITEEAALIKICEEWGFETGRTHIIGTPYYDATDYQFIRFNCAHMAWLWQNGNLLQVYC